MCIYEDAEKVEKWQFFGLFPHPIQGVWKSGSVRDSTQADLKPFPRVCRKNYNFSANSYCKFSLKKYILLVFQKTNMIEYTQYMQTKNVSSLNFNAQIRFANEPVSKKRSVTSSLRYGCKACKTISNYPKRICARIFAIPDIIKKIEYVKNSIKLPT